MTTIKFGRMKIIPMLEGGGWALPGGGTTKSGVRAQQIAFLMDLLDGGELTNEQRKHYIKHGGMGYAKHDA